MEVNENAIEWKNGEPTATITLASKRLTNRVLALQKTYPAQVEIVAAPDKNGGYLLAHIPAAWLKIQAPRQGRMMTEGEREAIRERLLSARRKNAREKTG